MRLFVQTRSTIAPGRNNNKVDCPASPVSFMYRLECSKIAVIIDGLVVPFPWFLFSKASQTLFAQIFSVIGDVVFSLLLRTVVKVILCSVILVFKLRFFEGVNLEIGNKIAVNIVRL